MKVSWTDVGNTEEPGAFEVGDSMVEVSAREIEIWRQHPDAVFTTIRAVPIGGQTVYALGEHETLA
jgi:hypothetical protein